MTKQEDYIIYNDDWDNDKPNKKPETVKMSNTDLPDGLEIIETKNTAQEISQEIQNAAKSEGMDTQNDYLGGKGASPEEVIKALKQEAMPEGAEKAREQYEEKKIKELKKTVATRDMLFSRLTRKIPIEIPIINESGEEEILVFYAKRLSESENNHLFNHRLIGKNLSDLTKEEYEDSVRFKRKTLALSIIQPKMTEEEWANEADNALTSKLFEEVQRIISEIDTVDDFQ